MQSIEQLTSVESQMSLKFAAITAKVMGDAVRLKMKADIEGDNKPFEFYVNLALNLHYNEYADSLNTENESYPDDVDLMNSAHDVVTENLINFGFNI